MTKRRQAVPHWIECSDFHGNEWVKCSNCLVYCQGWDGMTGITYNYCPMCGTRMSNGDTIMPEDTGGEDHED